MSKQRKGKTEFVRWMAPLLDCLRAVGGSARPREVSNWIIKKLDLGPEVTETQLKSGGNRFHNQVQWARQYLVWEGLIDDSKHGIWTLTPLGWRSELDDESARRIFLNRVRNSPKHRVPVETDSTRPVPLDHSQPVTRHFESDPETESAEDDESLPIDERQEKKLLDVIKSLPSFGFELLCERLLREHGFEDVQVTPKSRDGGIDGFGVLRLSPFVSMKIAFQAKRYNGAVSRQEVGQFRNDLLGKAEKGVLITTGRFTRDAEEEASRVGATPIELIDGKHLVELFEEKTLGVKPKQIFDIDHSFFDQFRDL